MDTHMTGDLMGHDQNVIQNLQASSEQPVGATASDQQEKCGHPVNSDTEGSIPSQRYRVTIEPMVFLLMIAASISSTVLQALYLERVCEQDLHWDEAHCANLSNSEKDTIQPHATNLLMAKSLLEALLPAALTLFLGSWSDLHGRRPLMIAPLAGYGGTYAAYAWLSTTKKMPAYFLVLGSLPLALSGGILCLVMATISYITDISSANQRSFRISMLETCIFVGYIIGTACSAPLLRVTGYVGIFSIASVLCFLGLFYTVLLVPESVQLPEQSGSVPFCISAKRLVTRVFQTCFAKRPGKRRTVILTTAAALASIVLSSNGDGAITYVFANKKFSWDVSDYTHFSLVGLILHGAATTPGIYLLVNLLGVSEAIVAAGACFCRMVGSVISAWSPQSWFLYLALGVSFPGAMVSSLMRSILSKCVPPQDVGKVFSLLAFLEALTPLVASPLYTLLYNSTVNTFPGMFALVSATIFALNTVVMLMVDYILLKYDPAVNYQQLYSSDDIDY